MTIRVQYMVQDLDAFIAASRSLTAGAIKTYSIENGRYATACYVGNSTTGLIQFVITVDKEKNLREAGFVKVKWITCE